MTIKKIVSDDIETKSADIVASNIDALKVLFPDAFTEGLVDFDVLKDLLGGAVDERDEKYGLNWHGKRRARQIALTPSTGTLLPYPNESLDWDSTQNMMIEGDNLEVLKILQKSFSDKIKMIYIDPPYNTGNDFVYPDDFRDNINNYLELTGQLQSGIRLNSNTELSGRFHTDWLSMMYPRLKLSRGLLRDDGIIFVSIADHEVYNLRIIMNEIFGEENFVATAIWQKVFSPKNTAKHFSEDHDYFIIYAKNAESWRPKLLPRTEEMESRYNNPDNDERGPWTSGDLSARNYYSEGLYPVTSPSGRVIPGPPPGTYWRVSKPNFDRLDREKRIWWGSDGSNVPRLKRFLNDVKQGRVPQTLWTYDEVGHTQEAKKEVMANVTFPNTEAVFDTPKPVRLIKRMLQIATQTDEADIVLDFFAGSGSTLHGVYAQNSEDNGNRRCILVQLPEPIANTKNSNIKTIADITKERLRNSARSVREQAPSFKGDLGFRVFKLAASNIRAWEPEGSAVEASLLKNAEHLVQGRTEADVLYELLLKLGLDLCVPIETKIIAQKTVHSVGLGTLIVCLTDSITKEVVEPLSAGIVAWLKELAPAVDTRVVFKDSGFADDIAKTNMAAILNQNGISDVRSL